MGPSRIIERNQYAQMAVDEAQAVVLQYSRVVAMETPCWFMPTDCLCDEAAKIAAAIIVTATETRRRGESCHALETLHSQLSRFSNLPDLDRATYHLVRQSRGQRPVLDEAAYLAAHDRETQVRVQLAQDWQEFELNAHYMPVYDYLAEQLPLPDLDQSARLIDEYAAALSSKKHIHNLKLREWLPASKQDICRALALEFLLSSKRTKDDCDHYIMWAGHLDLFIEDPELSRVDRLLLSVGINPRKRLPGIVYHRDRRCAFSGYWMDVFECMAAAYEVRLGDIGASDPPSGR